jgi:hypothetical protein
MHLEFSSICKKVLLLIAIAIAICLYAQDVPILTDDYNEIEFYNEVNEEIETIQSTGLYINHCSFETLLTLGFSEEDASSIIAYRTSNEFEAWTRLESVVTDKSLLNEWKKYVIFGNIPQMDFNSINRYNHSLKDGDNRINLKQRVLFGSNTLQLISNKDYSSKDLELFKSITCFSDGNKTVDYIVGNYYFHFGKGLIYQAGNNKSNGFYPVNSVTNYHPQGASVIAKFKDFTINPFYLTQEKFPTVIDDYLSTKVRDPVVNSYGSVISWKYLSILMANEVTKENNGGYLVQKSNWSLALNKTLGRHRFKAEVTLCDEPSISATLRSNSEDILYISSIDLIRNANERPFAKYYNNFRNFPNYQEYQSRVKLKSVFLHPEFSLKYRSASDSDEIEENVNIYLPFERQSIHIKAKHVYDLQTNESKFRYSAKYKSLITKNLQFGLDLAILDKMEERTTLLKTKVSYEMATSSVYMSLLTISTNEQVYLTNSIDSSNEYTELLTSDETRWELGYKTDIAKQLKFKAVARGTIEGNITNCYVSIAYSMLN